MPGQPGCHIRFETAIATELKDVLIKFAATWKTATMAPSSRAVANKSECRIGYGRTALGDGHDAEHVGKPEFARHDRGPAAGRLAGCGAEDRPLHRCGHGRRAHDLHADEYDGGSYRRCEIPGEDGGRTAETSSVYFGSHEPDYPTMQDCMSVVGMDTAKGLGQGDARAHAKLLKSKLQVSSFQIGYDEPTAFLPCTRAIRPSTSRRNVSCRKSDGRFAEGPIPWGRKVIYETDMGAQHANHGV